MKLNRKALPWMALWLSAVLLAVVLAYGLPGKKKQRPPSPFPVAADSQALGLDGPPPLPPAPSKPTVVPVYLTKERRIDRVALETYVHGVVAAEMPPDFEPEALKAQAMAARTYIVRRIADHDFSGVPVKDAWVTDTVQHQAYLTDETLKERWKETYEAKMDKITRAVDETKDLILTYGGRPIMAAFFSTSNGYTENSEDYWADAIPYLRSVPSPWDKAVSPEFVQKTRLPLREFASRLGIRSSAAAAAASSGVHAAETSSGHRIKKLGVAGKSFTGREVRERLGLPSSQFDWQLKGGQVEITSFGYGHGVGMSQWGADGMAREGSTAEEIVKYYYTGIEIRKDTEYINQS